MNRENLAKLADYLWHNIDPEDFNIRYYTHIQSSASSVVDKMVKCGPCGCAVGYSAGLFDKTPQEDWYEYSMRVFGVTNDDAWHWCFGAHWCKIDNTPRGAAKRIIYMLSHKSITSMMKIGSTHMMEDLPRKYDKYDISKLYKMFPELKG